MGLPKEEYAEQVLSRWEREGLPKLNFKEPWYSCHLGHWREEDVYNAQLIVSGEYHELWAKLNQNRVPMRDLPQVEED